MVNSNGWIGVDFDGTLAEYHGWTGWNVFGKPIAPMVDRVKRWIAEGKDVRIFTARVGIPGDFRFHACRHTGVRFTSQMMIAEIQQWTIKHIGVRLQVTCVKDVDMIEFWDDRAVQVVANTGRTLAEEHEAEMSALRGVTFQGASEGPEDF